MADVLSASLMPGDRPESGAHAGPSPPAGPSTEAGTEREISPPESTSEPAGEKGPQAVPDNGTQPAQANGVYSLPKDAFAIFRAAALTFAALPSIYQRPSAAQAVLGPHVPDWRTVKANRHSGPARHSMLAETGMSGHHHDRQSPKTSKVNKAKGQASGRTYTSKYRGVHQTFPTKRWEAQFRRNGKPTSLGCFDHEEQAARAYDKMMLWCELHNTSGVKGGGITNFDPTEYEKDLVWLQTISQEDLVQASRSEGRRQTAHGKAQRVITPEARRERMRMHTRRRGARSYRQYESEDEEEEEDVEMSDATGDDEY